MLNQDLGPGMLWKLKLRLPKSVESVVIRTSPDTEEEARRVAEIHIQKLASPFVKFISVERMIVAQSECLDVVEHPAVPAEAALSPGALTPPQAAAGDTPPAASKKGPKPPAKPAKVDPALDREAAAAGGPEPGAPRSSQPAGRIGA